MPSTAPSLQQTPRLTGASNFRDMGGLPSSDGRRLRRGRLFRSGELSRLTDADLEQLRAIRIQTVLDLRSRGEQEHWPSRWPHDAVPEIVAAHIDVDLRSGDVPLRRILEEDLSETGARRLLIETYRRLPDALLPTLTQMFERIASGTLPLLIHCTAGKDRTGFACACLLEAAGVSREDIVVDYLQTNAMIDLDAMAETTGQVLERVLGLRVSRPTLDVINGVQEDYLTVAFDALAADYGSMESYLLRMGLDHARRAQLRNILLED